MSKVPPISDVVWQQPPETITNQCNLNNNNNDSTVYYTQETSQTSVASQTSPTKRTQPRNDVVATEHLPRNQTGNEPVPFLNCSKNRPTDIRKSEHHVTTTHTGDTTFPPLTTTTPLIEEGLVRDEQTKVVNLPLICTIDLKRKKEMLHVPVDFENNLTVDALVDSGAFVNAISQDDLDTIKQKYPKKNSQTRRSSQFSDTRSQWPVRKTTSNNGTQIWNWS